MILSGSARQVKGLASLVLCCSMNETGDRGFQVVDGSEHAVFQPSSGEFGEETFDGVQP